MEALLKEVELFACGRENYQVSSVFIGGGTPSLVDEIWIRELMERIKSRFWLEEQAEVTIEVNPGTLTEGKLSCYRDAGINRISIGLQSANNRELQMLGRIHTWEDFLKSYGQIRKVGFKNVNVDLMSALPGQTEKSWEDTLRRVCALLPEHISAYSLILEEGTPFFEQYGKAHVTPEEERLPSEEEDRAMYAFTGQYLKEMGYHRYEISNYARADMECRHNNGYWTGVLYKGFGIGAASYLLEDGRFIRCSNIEERKPYEQLLKAWDSRGEDFGIEKDGQRRREVGAALLAEREVLSEENRMEEFFFLGLRRMEGVSEQEFFRRFHRKAEAVYGPVLKKLASQGLLRQQGGRIFLTEYGIDVSNQVFMEFLL